MNFSPARCFPAIAILAACSTLEAATPTVPEGTFAPINGVGNNISNPAWGSAGNDLLRIAPAGYADGIDAPALPGNRSARAISNILNNQADPNAPSQDLQTVDQNSLADFGYAFGQFMDHDMDNTPDGGASLPIAVAAGDPIGPAPLPFTRSQTDPSTGIGTGQPAQQVTTITAYLDLSQVYGSSQVVATALRALTGGQLKTSPGNMLPYDNATYFTPSQIAALNMENDPQAVPTSQLFAAGDVRANENLELTVLETLFVRNHNLIAAQLQQANPGWSDEQLYQEARKLNIAEYQNIIYTEWIPSVLGPNALPAYAGYNPEVNASIANEFSTVAYRFGHSMVSDDIARDGNDGQALTSNIPLSVDFFDPNLLNPSGAVDPLTGLTSTDIGPILKGEADGNGQAMDLTAINDIRNLLFGNGVIGGQDLIALDLQRAREHGIPDYNTVRAAFGLAPVQTFDQVIDDTNTTLGVENFSVQDLLIVQELAQAYPGGIGTIDAFEGGLSEHHVTGSDVGPTFQAILTDQFQRLRDGDRFFYLNESFSANEQTMLQEESTLAKVIEANTPVTNLQSNVVMFQASIGGTVSGGPPGVTVELEDDTGDILATTQTDQQGQYSFNQLSGPSANPDIAPGVSATGIYDVIVVAPTGLTQVTPDPAPIPVGQGDTQVTGINFTLAPANVGPSFTLASPAAITIQGGRSVALNAPATGSPAPTYQWTFNGQPISGATDSILLLSSVTSANQGTYACMATNSTGSATSSATTLTVAASPSPGYLSALSARAFVGTGNNILIGGLVIKGSSPAQFLLRGVGPLLATEGLSPSAVLAQPQLTLYDSSSAPIVTDIGWDNGFIAGTSVVSVDPQPATAALMISLGVPLLSSGSADSALVVTATPPNNLYTFQVSGAGGATGLGLAEIYDVNGNAAGTRLADISARAGVGANANILIGGFVIGGATSETVLIRGVGPGLYDYFGLPSASVLAQSTLTIYDSSQQVVATNTGWGGDPVLINTAAAVGDFPLSTAPVHPDSALLLTLPPGAYTAQVSGANSATGIALVEVYEVP